MQIYVSKNSHQLGPYSAAEARNFILTGQLAGADLAWHAGLPQWTTLSEVLASQPSHPVLGPIAATEPPAPSLSPLAIISLGVSIVGAIGWIGLLVFVAIADKHGRTKDENDPVIMVFGLLCLAGMAVNVLGAIGGIVALVKRTSHRWMAITGIILNALEFLVVFGLMIIGIVTK